MRVFVSYAHEDFEIAEEISRALEGAGHSAFLDKKDLPPGQEFNVRIRAGIQNSDLFLFLASPSSVRPGSYALTELSFAEQKWRRPQGSVLPVMLSGLDPRALPPYLQQVNVLVPKGNTAAEVANWVEDRVELGSFAEPGILGLQERFGRWAIRAVAPEKEPTPRVPPWTIMLALLALFGIPLAWFGFVSPDITISPLRHLSRWLSITYFIVGAFGAYRGYRIYRAAKAGRVKPSAVLVLQRESNKVHLQDTEGRRFSIVALVEFIYAGDMGWAYIVDGQLIDFVSAVPMARAPIDNH